MPDFNVQRKITNFFLAKSQVSLIRRKPARKSCKSCEIENPFLITSFSLLFVLNVLYTRLKKTRFES